MKNDIKPGDTVKVYQILKETTPKGEMKQRIQIFEGLVLARKHGKENGSTITVRRIVDGIGVEKIFPLDSPLIQKIELVKRSKVRRSKLYFLRSATGKRARLKTIKFFSKEEQPEQWEGKDVPIEEVPVEETTEEVASAEEVVEETKEEAPAEEVVTEETPKEEKSEEKDDDNDDDDDEEEDAEEKDND